jgi:phosphoglucosamine mutase
VGEFAAAMHRFPQVIVNVKVAEREGLATAVPVREAAEAAERALGEAGRVVVRASGTEPLVRVMVEAEDAATAQAHADAVAEAVRRTLGTT